MNKTVVIHQPDFLPYIGFFHRLLKCDLFVILDNVQFINGSSRSWHSRDKIKTPYGEKWITLAVQKCPLDTKINEVVLSKNVDWRTNHLNQFKENYRKSPFFDEIFDYIKELYSFECDKMSDFNIKSIRMLMDLFGIDLKTELASSLDCKGRGNELVVEILKKVRATKYLSGIGAKAYYDPKPFEDAHIEVEWQDFRHPLYEQLHGQFIPFLSSIDMLFNCGIEKSREIIRSV